MKTVTFKRVVELGFGAAHQQFRIGTHHVPEELCTGWFFEALVKDGDAIVAQADVPESKPAEGSTLLDLSAKDVLLALQSRTFTEDALLELVEMEQTGKNRKTVVDELYSLIEAIK